MIRNVQDFCGASVASGVPPDVEPEPGILPTGKQCAKVIAVPFGLRDAALYVRRDARRYGLLLSSIVAREP